MISAERYHDFSAGHRVVGHEGKCRHLHGHNYRCHFVVLPINGLDSLGRVLDFGVIKTNLCMWLEDNWDHKMLIWREDPILQDLQEIDNTVVVMPFNPTAENMAKYLVEMVAPVELAGTGAMLLSVKLEETRKCSASYTKGIENVVR